MKIITSLPGNQDFFNRYAALVPTLFRLGIFAQVITAVTEVGIIYSLIYSGVVDFFPKAAPVMGMIGAIIGTGLLEFGSRVFVPYSVRAVLFRRYEGLDLVMTVFIFGVTLGLLVTSGILSFHGSRSMVESFAPAPEQRTTAAADSIYQAGLAHTISVYRADSAGIATRFQELVKAQRGAFESKIHLEQAKLARYDDTEKATGQSYASRKQSIRSTILRLEAERDQKIATLSERQAAELGMAESTRRANLAVLQSEYDQAKKGVQVFNREAEADSAAKVHNYGYGLAWFSVFALLVFVFSVVLDEVNRKGAVMEEIAQANQYDFFPSVWTELVEAINERWQYLSRSRIRAFQEATPVAPLPLAPAPLYNLGGLEQQRFEVKVFGNDQNENMRVVYLPVRNGEPPRASAPAAEPAELAEKAMQYVQAEIRLEGENLHDAAQEMHLKAIDVIRAYLGADGTDQAVDDLYYRLVDFFNGKGPNPFEHLHRKPIGFHFSSVTGDKTSNRSSNNPKENQEPIAAEVLMVENGIPVQNLTETGLMDSTSNVGQDVLHSTVNNGPVKERLKLIDNLIRTCEHCGQEYRAKALNQRFCCTDCRFDFHAKEHGGTRFDPSRKKRRKKI